MERVVFVTELFNSDRDFSEDVIKQQNMVVAQHNDLITKAKYDLTTNEIKVMDYIISKIKPDDEEFDVVDSSLYEISNVLGLKRSGRTYNQLTNTLRNLRQTELITNTIYDHTTNEIKVMDYIISKIKPDDEEFDVVDSSLYEISKVLGLKRSGRTYNQLTNTLRNLRQKEVIIYNEETETATVT